MRRVLFAVAGLAAGTTLLVVLKTGPEVTPVARLATPATAVGTPAPAGTAGADPSGPAPTATHSRPASEDSGSAKPRTTQRTPTAPRTSAAPKPATGPRTLYGSVVKAPGYGNVQVQITVSGGAVTAVEAIELPFDTPTSEQKSASVRARYETKGEALAYATGRSARLDTVSGATATSTAYRTSLQAALDQR
ncbi:FMN-binding protein [Plantactinospora sp. KBS50]|uniref:FMN-binding protein n=1 Tax=Plantactinospora sp. KBS50 TaxID=2024580 RepID=UPI000BAAA5FC|nr:FMN-binding protein [Plantactinospora sp. KBS50]ASW56138.1 hypothetical protein CIK06_21175 [Plantactinospora sp. KBS50]